MKKQQTDTGVRAKMRRGDIKKLAHILGISRQSVCAGLAGRTKKAQYILDAAEELIRTNNQNIEEALANGKVGNT